MNEGKMMPGGIAFALMTERKELLGMAMRGLRQQAQEGQLTGEALEHVLNALEALCADVIDTRLKGHGFGDSDEDEDDPEVSDRW
jgi:hypothetical protein